MKLENSKEAFGTSAGVINYYQAPELQDSAFLKRVLNQGGPYPDDYRSLEKWVTNMFVRLEKDSEREVKINQLRKAFGDVLSSKTLLGHSFQKPYGYAGDFEIIDKIYRKDVSPDQAFTKWDLHFHNCTSAKAVRNRKSYLKGLLYRIETSSKGETIRVLNIASGPGRSVFEYFNDHPKSRISMDCIDSESKAVSFAEHLCLEHKQVSYSVANAIKFRPRKSYNLIWSAGLFDYLNDRIFVNMLKRYYDLIEVGGELVIGNFSKNNPNRTQMELLADWILIYRSEEELIDLVKQAGIPVQYCWIGSEAEGVNLFLHVIKQ